MVGEGRKSFLTHILLWIIIPIILFPIIWVVSTSVRRDQAAFSTKLFSSRLTLQNYIDLLTPEKNIPVLIQELQNLISRTTPYNEWSSEKIEGLILEDINRLQDYIRETEERYKASKESFEKIEAYLSEKLMEIKEKNIKNLEELRDFLNKKIPKEGLKEDINRVGKSNKKEINIFEREYQNIQREILGIYRAFNEEISPEVDMILRNIKKDVSFASFSSTRSTNLWKVINKLEKFPDFSEISRKLKEISYNISSQINNKTIKEIDSLCVRISYLIEKLERNINRLALLEQKNEFLEIQEEILGGKEEETIPSETGSKIDELRVFLKDLEGKIEVVNNTENLEDLIYNLATIEENLTEFFSNYIFNYGRDEIASKIEEIAGKLRWIQEYYTFSERYSIFSQNLNNVLEKTQGYFSEFNSSWRSLFERSLKGEFVTSEILDNLYNLVKMDYINSVASNLNIVSKKAGDLMDIIPFKNLKGYLDKIDGEVFRIDQIWKQKTKHYFLRWVRNSILVAGIAALITTTVCSIAAYPFSRMRFWGRKYGIMTLLLIQMFPSAVYMIAIYSLLNLIGRFIPFLGLDTLSGLTFVYLGGIAYNMYIIKGFYDTIPDSLEESAMIDGATRFQTFYKIVIPLAKPILAVVVILTFMNVFNEFIFASIILQDAKNYTYAIGLWTFSTGPYLTEWGLFTAAALLGMLPMTILFLSLQKYIVSGLTKGAVKG